MTRQSLIRKGTAAAVLLIAVALTACGGDSDPEGEPSAEPSSATESTVPPMATPGGVPAGVDLEGLQRCLEEEGITLPDGPRQPGSARSQPEGDIAAAIDACSEFIPEGIPLPGG